MSRRLIVLLALLALTSLAATGCTQKNAQAVKLAPMSRLPQAMQDAPASVRTAYQFAVAHPDALRNVPCYCGCGAIGHKSNLACYIKDVSPDGEIIFDDHALGCSICVDIATDVMKMTAEGRAPDAIRAEIVKTYSAFGPPNQ
jgi:hypothetical protein